MTAPTLVELGAPAFCDHCGSPNEIILKSIDEGRHSTKTGVRLRTGAYFVRCTKLRGIGRVRNLRYNRDFGSGGHTDELVRR